MREQLLDPAVDAMPAPQDFAGGVIESIPGVAAAYLTGPAAPLVAMAQSGGAQFNDARQRMQEQGATYEQAAQIGRAEAGAMGMFTGLTSVPIFGELATCKPRKRAKPAPKRRPHGCGPSKTRRPRSS
jgi:hypothetical protein